MDQPNTIQQVSEETGHEPKRAQENTHLPSEARGGGPLVGQHRALFEALARGGGDAVGSPWPALDSLLYGGWQAGDLYLLASPPRGGTTCFAAQCLDHAAAAGHPCLYVGFAGNRADFVVSALARKTELASDLISRRALSPAQARTVAEALEAYLELEGRSLEVWEAESATEAENILDWVERWRAVLPEATPLVVIDPIESARGLTQDRGPATSERGWLPRVTEVLKDVARDARAAVLGVTSIAEPAADAALLRRGEDAVLAQAGLPELGSVDGVVSIHTEILTLEHTEAGAKSRILIDPWAMLGWLADRKGDPRQTPLLSRSVHEFARRYPQGGPGDAVRARLALARHRRGGDVLVYYHRAWQRIDQVDLPGSATDSADACDPAEAAAVFEGHLRS